jgi:Spx/MgsR family transcriptional regulator
VNVAIVIYGIKNCDTMKKARAWLDRRGIEYVFHDYKAAGIERERLERWARKLGWESLINRAGTTFRKLPDKDKAALSEKRAISLMLDQPSMIRRPVVELGGGKVLVGFDSERYRAGIHPSA